MMQDCTLAEIQITTKSWSSEFPASSPIGAIPPQQSLSISISSMALISYNQSCNSHSWHQVPVSIGPCPWQARKVSYYPSTTSPQSLLPEWLEVSEYESVQTAIAVPLINKRSNHFAKTLQPCREGPPPCKSSDVIHCNMRPRGDKLVGDIPWSSPIGKLAVAEAAEGPHRHRSYITTLDLPNAVTLVYCTAVIPEEPTPCRWPAGRLLCGVHRNQALPHPHLYICETTLHILVLASDHINRSMRGTKGPKFDCLQQPRCMTILWTTVTTL